MTAGVVEAPTAQLPEHSDIVTMDRAQMSDRSFCPHCVTRATRVGTLPVCAALPVFAPISSTRMQTHCAGAAHTTCPHFVYGSDESRREQAGPSATRVSLVWLNKTFGESLWVIGIPLTIMVVIITALFLTQ